jgi:outer membrane protein TolC
MLRSAIPAWLLTALVIPLPGVAAQAPSAPSGPVLTLPALLDTVAVRSPRLRAAEASAEAALHRVEEAATLPDPMVQFGVMNVGLPDFDAGMPASMAPSVQLVQTFPFPGKLGLQRRLAEASSEMVDYSSDETWWALRDRAASLFYDLYALDRRVEVMSETLGLLGDFRTIARALYASGGGRQADVLRADVEVVRMEGELKRLGAMRTATAARLNGLLDRSADTPVPQPVLSPLPERVPVADTLLAWAVTSNPALQRGRVALGRAEDAAELAGRQIWPDVMVGVTYGRRDRGEGTEHMGSAMVGFSLPIHAGKRQYAARSEAMALRRVADADLAEARSDVGARLGVLLAELDAARSLLDLYRTDVLPEARATVESALSSYRVGNVDFMTLVDAERSVQRYETEYFDLLADYGRAVASLESVVGRPLPTTPRTLAISPEDR